MYRFACPTIACACDGCHSLVHGSAAPLLFGPLPRTLQFSVSFVSYSHSQRSERVAEEMRRCERQPIEYLIIFSTVTVVTIALGIDDGAIV